MGRGDGTAVLEAPETQARGSAAAAPERADQQVQGTSLPKRFLDPAPEVAQAAYERYKASRLRYRVLTETSDVERLVAVLREHGVSQVAVDFETAKGENDQHGPTEARLRTIQIGVNHPAFGGYRQWIIDCDHADPRPIRPLLESYDVEKVIHYSPFEQEWAMSHLDCEIKNVWDTCFAGQSINKEFGRWLENPEKGRAAVDSVVQGWRKLAPTEKPSSLGTMSRSYLGIEIPKEEQDGDWGAEDFSEDQREYMALDVALPLDLVNGMKRIADGQKIGGRLNWRFRNARDEARETVAQNKTRSRELAWKLSDASSIEELQAAWRGGEPLKTGIGWDDRDALCEFYSQCRSDLASA